MFLGGFFDPLLEFGGAQVQERSIPCVPAEVIPAQANAISVRGGPPVFGIGLIEAIPESNALG